MAQVAGSATGQVLVVLSAPFLTRYYAPQEFGVFGIYLTVFAVLNLVSSFRYDLSIVLPRSTTVAAANALLSLALTGVTAAVVAILAIRLGDALASRAGVPSLGAYLWILPWAVLVGGGGRVMSYWALRERRHNAIASARVGQDSSMVAAQVVAGSAGVGVLGLVLGHAIGLSVAFLTLFGSARRSAADLIRSARWQHLARSFRRYRRFPLYTAWGDLANVLTKQLPILLFADLFSVTSAGFYALAFRVANAPVAVVSEGAGNAFLSTAARASRGRLIELTGGVFVLLLRVALAPFLLVTAFAPEVFSLVFGPEWYEAGVYTRLMVPHSAAVFIFMPLLWLMFVLERQRSGLIFQMTLLSSSVVGFLAGATWGGAGAAIASYSVATALVYAGFGLWIMRVAGVPFHRLAGILLQELAFVAPLGAVLFVALTANSPLAFRGQQSWVPAVVIGALMVLWAARAMKSWVHLRTIDDRPLSSGPHAARTDSSRTGRA